MYHLSKFSVNLKQIIVNNTNKEQPILKGQCLDWMRTDTPEFCPQHFRPPSLRWLQVAWPQRGRMPSHHAYDWVPHKTRNLFLTVLEAEMQWPKAQQKLFPMPTFQMANFLPSPYMMRRASDHSPSSFIRTQTPFRKAQQPPRNDLTTSPTSTISPWGGGF